MLHQEVFSFGLGAHSSLFITYNCVRGINNMLCLPAWNIHDLVLEILSAITDVHHQAGPLFVYTKVLQMPWISFWDKDGGGHRGVVSFGFEHDWTKADGLCMGIIGYCLSCDMRTLPVISTTSECKQNAVSIVEAPWTRSARTVTTRYTQMWRRESADNPKLERCRNAKVAGRSPSSGKIWNSAAISRRSWKFKNAVQSQWQRR